MNTAIYRKKYGYKHNFIFSHMEYRDAAHMYVATNVLYQICELAIENNMSYFVY